MAKIAQNYRAPVPAAPEDDFSRAVLEGLSLSHKALPCWLFYDAVGDALFEQITQLPEYYLTRAETEILAAAAPEIAARAPPGSVLVEFGSGSSRKTEILLDALPGLAAYAPIDVSASALAEAERRLNLRHPGLEIVALEGDFTRSIDLPLALGKRPRLGFFPGSTIGNLAPVKACELLRQMRESLAPSAGLVIGVDLLKNAQRLAAAYDDAQGVTAKFNLNLLARINHEMGANFDIDRFAHVALFNAAEGRIEMHLESLAAQIVCVGGHAFRFAKGERIHTENSYKYTVSQFQDLAARAGWRPRQVWTDRENLFSVHDLMQAD